MSDLQISRNSFLSFSRFLTSEVDGVESWDLGTLPTILAQPDDKTDTVLGTDTVARIAYRNYGDPRLKWVICQANGIEDPILELRPGQEIRIPSPRYVFQELFASAVNR